MIKKFKNLKNSSKNEKIKEPIDDILDEIYINKNKPDFLNKYTIQEIIDDIKYYEAKLKKISKDFANGSDTEEGTETRTDNVSDSEEIPVVRKSHSNGTGIGTETGIVSGIRRSQSFGGGLSYRQIKNQLEKMYDQEPKKAQKEIKKLIKILKNKI